MSDTGDRASTGSIKKYVISDSNSTTVYSRYDSNSINNYCWFCNFQKRYIHTYPCEP